MGNNNTHVSNMTDYPVLINYSKETPISFNSNDVEVPGQNYKIVKSETRLYFKVYGKYTMLVDEDQSVIFSDSGVNIVSFKGQIKLKMLETPYPDGTAKPKRKMMFSHVTNLRKRELTVYTSNSPLPSLEDLQERSLPDDVEMDTIRNKEYMTIVSANPVHITAVYEDKQAFDGTLDIYTSIVFFDTSGVRLLADDGTVTLKKPK